MRTHIPALTTLPSTAGKEKAKQTNRATPDSFRIALRQQPRLGCAFSRSNGNLQGLGYCTVQTPTMFLWCFQQNSPIFPSPTQSPTAKRPLSRPPPLAGTTASDGRRMDVFSAHADKILIHMAARLFGRAATAARNNAGRLTASAEVCGPPTQASANADNGIGGCHQAANFGPAVLSRFFLNPASLLPCTPIFLEYGKKAYSD